MAKETKSKKEPKLLKENSAKRLADSGTKKLKAGETKKIGVSAARAKKIKHTYQVKDAENALLLKLKDGDVVIEMYPEDAPEHVKRIKELARAEFYNGLKFHRVIDGFMAQTGCPYGNGTGGTGKKLKAEFNRNPHKRGTVSMAESGIIERAIETVPRLRGASGRGISYLLFSAKKAAGSKEPAAGVLSLLENGRVFAHGGSNPREDGVGKSGLMSGITQAVFFLGIT